MNGLTVAQNKLKKCDYELNTFCMWQLRADQVLESFHKILEKSIGQFQRYLNFLISYVIKVLGFLQFCSLIRAKLRSRAFPCDNIPNLTLHYYYSFI